MQSFTVHPEKIALQSADDAQQFVVTAGLAGGRLQDLTGDVKYVVADEKVARVTPSGRVLPVGQRLDRRSQAVYGDKTLTIPVTAANCDVNLPINFGNQIVPIFTKLGCNSGGCHGKASGQNGFKMSLLGFEPEVDYTALVKEARGRRVFPAAPDNSLLLLKASGGIAHGGGKRMEVGSDEYRLIRRWIAAGTPFGKPTDPVGHEHHRLSRPPRHDAQQQAAVRRLRPLQRRLRRRRHAPRPVREQRSGNRRRGRGRPGPHAGDERRGGRHGPLPGVRLRLPRHRAARRADPGLHFRAENAWSISTRRPSGRNSALCPPNCVRDEQFIRRLSLDLTGTLPTPAQVTAFVADTDPQKRDQLVDTLLESPEYSYYFANKWADILRVKRRGQTDRARGTFAFHDWIRDAIANDKPYDQFAREILGASGDEVSNPPTVWYKELQEPQQFVDDTAQVFLGLRLACAQCHHHPYEKWSQDDYWGIAAFFGRVGRKKIPVPGEFDQQAVVREAVFNRSSGSVINKRTGQTAVMKPLDGEPVKVGPDDDPRQKLVDWMVDPTNPFFARAVANRYWAHFFGRGIVDPLGRHARHQPAVATPNCSTRWPRTWWTTSTA